MRACEIAPARNGAERLRTDVHQHLWPEQLLGALARRSRPPRLRRPRDGGGWAVELDGEPPAPVRPADHDPEARADLVRADGLDRALIALSSPLGIESLPRAEAEPLLAAYHEGVAALPGQFGGWGAVALDEPDPAEVEALLERGFDGVSLPAAALATPAGLDRCGPLLEVLERRGAPLLVHPGPAPWAPREPVDAGAPAWFPALTRYVAEMNAVWHAFLAAGRAAHPRLRVLFAMLAGCAPLHAERLLARGGPYAAGDPDVFLDASSYGVRALDATVRCLGVDQLVYGSDRPVAGARDCPLGAAVREAMLVRNPARLLRPQEVPA